MIPRLLPWAPRPHSRESLSGWVRRVASRYDVTAACLCKHLLGEKTFDDGRIERLDHRADPEMVGLLAAAARIAPARLRAMRVANDDGTASSWFRVDTAWCPECVRDDLAQGPETYERAIWRLGCSVVCPDHGALLQDTCGQCWKQARCRFRPAQGWLGLACLYCKGLPYSPSQPFGGLGSDREGAFDVQLTSDLAALVADLQRDLQASLRGSDPQRSWGVLRSGPTLLGVVRDLALKIMLATNVKVEQRTELVMNKESVPFVTVLHEPVTPAALSPHTAFGVLATAAALLDSLGRDGGARHTSRQNTGSLAIDALSFMEWLGSGARR